LLDPGISGFGAFRHPANCTYKTAGEISRHLKALIGFQKKHPEPNHHHFTAGLSSED
jgi:hypothetical protein